MPLTGIEIFKLLPKTNCGECGVPTCLAFAMNLAAGKAELAKCPKLSEEARAKLQEASAPPIRPVIIGTGKRVLKTGGETVMFRHEKRFENPTGIAVLIPDNLPPAEIEGRLIRFNTLEYERVGLKLRSDLVAVKDTANDPVRFSAVINQVKSATDAGLILISTNPNIMAEGLKICADRKPLLFGINKDNVDKMAVLAMTNNCPAGIKAANLDEAAELTVKLNQYGVNDIVIDSGARTVRKVFEDQVIIRSSALVKKFRPLGYPTITFPVEITHDPLKEAMIASLLVAKYSGIIVLSDIQGEILFPLLVQRMNLFTDPQRPLATTPGIYEFNKPNENSPVLITSNFSLTYFIVSGEVENSKVPSWLLVMDTEGLSVMTAWAAGKFVADTISVFVKKSGITEKVKHRKLIIPGYAAIEAGGLEEELPGWQIMVGPRDGAHIPAYLKMLPA
jgi:acetyl-CoA decarbonylase/synthase, CODH/ACS complex subunit gamma